MDFKIGFEIEDKKKLFEYWNEILENNVWTEGKFTKKFEENWSIYNSKKTVSFSSWSGAAESVIKYYKSSFRQNGRYKFAKIFKQKMQSSLFVNRIINHK